MRALSFALSVMPLFAAVATARGGDVAMLREAATKWLGERDRWAFARQVRDLADDGRVEQVRLERYDPSRAPSARWELLAIDGKTPTAEQRSEWQKRRRVKKPKPDFTLEDLFDLKNAQVLLETPKVVTYDLPLRRTIWVVFPDKVDLTVTVGKSNRAIEHVRVGIREPFHVALGLARLTSANVDVHMKPPPAGATAADPGSAKPEGAARMTLTKLGKRTEYLCTEFRRVEAWKGGVLK